MERVLGIDLGTTYSCVAVVENGTPMVIANKGGYRTTPSMVAFTSGGRRLVGQLAKRQAVTNPTNTVYSVKRFIGRKWDSDIVQKVKGTVPYSMVEGPHNDIRIEVQQKQYSVPEISAMVLTEMKRIAEECFGTSVNLAVVTVPAFFNDGQRSATKDAGKIAGLELLRIINEPTAAALAYGFGKQVDEKIAVYDLGGGTFDISLLDIGQGVYEVVATAGDTFLGGEDFDQRVANWIVSAFIEENQIDPRSDLMALQRIKDAAEQAKCELSFQNEVEVNLPFLFTAAKNKTLHFHKVLARAQLEELTVDLIDRTIEICNKTLVESGLSKNDISEVILVGGQSRMPKVQAAVQKFFEREPSKSVHPDEVVAQGASIQGYALVAEKSGVRHDKPLLLDVTPQSLGIMIVGGYFQRLIEKNTTVPTSASHLFTTVKDGQSVVRIMVFQGESTVASENEMLGEFILTGLREARRGEVEIEVTFDISADGIVSVLARDMETGRRQSIVVTATSGLTEEEVKRMTEENQDYLLAAAQDQFFDKLRSKIDGLIGEIETLLPLVTEVVTTSALSNEPLSKAATILETAKKAIAQRDLENVDNSIEPLERTLSIFRNLAGRWHPTGTPS
jgi:Molecular chaperone